MAVEIEWNSYDSHGCIFTRNCVNTVFYMMILVTLKGRIHIQRKPRRVKISASHWILDWTVGLGIIHLVFIIFLFPVRVLCNRVQ